MDFMYHQKFYICTIQMENTMNNDPFILGGVTLASRLFLGTGKYGADSGIKQRTLFQ